MAPGMKAQYGGSNFFWCFDIQLPNGTYTSPSCCISYYESSGGYYTGVDCVGAYVSEDSSIYYCRNGNPDVPEIPGAVNPGCCGSKKQYLEALSKDFIVNSAMLWLLGCVAALINSTKQRQFFQDFSIRPRDDFSPPM
ncbi:hypothetical protein BKA67DRAFT_542162 [Truncatella angustata]|uniref:Uncharacterized protein n=1 Tax=Truncatella angustata TaxID=152316 RepID=A0A9P8RFQ7_9PEZI|nr:uncharacterized protein BKA67DRAFT_542162 [Truncatella angustata]KAH6645188.1 hypothetical protein BKA67DRAFT_542162 [Truncatella angustata]